MFRWRWTITVHRGYITFRIPVLQVAMGMIGLGLGILCAVGNDLSR